MLKRIKLLSQGNLLIIAISITLGIIYLSLFKPPKNGIEVDNIDKLYHFIAYFTLSFVWLITFYKKPSKKLTITSLCVLFGIIIEVLQSTLTNYRTADYIDIIANSIGVFIALFFFNLIFRKKEFK